LYTNIFCETCHLSCKTVVTHFSIKINNNSNNIIFSTFQWIVYYNIVEFKKFGMFSFLINIFFKVSYYSLALSPQSIYRR